MINTNNFILLFYIVNILNYNSKFLYEKMAA
jgi:hypothetical protein